MFSRRLGIRVPSLLEGSLLLQILLVVGLWLGADGFVHITGLPVPGGLVGLIAALALLASRRLSVRSLRRGSQFFIGHMVLFFLPAVLAVLDHRELMSVLGCKVLLVIVAGTAAVMVVTALVVDLCTRAKGVR
ncbi:MAG: CidA/LrgA family protein [Alphaproteobacteria bacterium]|nr:CidA/LrgA family protein [Alphaproteobacteria bacterium]